MLNYKDLHIVIYLSFDCNLRCSYCVINFDKYIMSNDVIYYIQKFININHSKFNNVFIEFIGGEPLLQSSKILSIINNKDNLSNIKFQVTTNGTIIDDYIYNSFIVNIDKVNLSFNENYFSNNLYFKKISSNIIDKNNININFIYDPRKDIEKIKNNFLFILEQGYKSISILPIVLVYNYTKQDFKNLIIFIEFIKNFSSFINIELLYYIQEKKEHFEITINPNGDVLGDNMGTAEDFFGVTDKLNLVIGNIKDITIEEVFLKLKDYNYINYLKNITIKGNVSQKYDNLLLLSNLLKKYNDKISFRNGIY